MAEIIDNLVAELVAARSAEADAKAHRIRCEEAILAQFQLGEAERKTINTDNGLKLVLKTGLIYKLASVYPGHMPVKTKVELDAKAYDALRESSPDEFKELSKYVTVTPRKPSVSVGVR